MTPLIPFPPALSSAIRNHSPPNSPKKNRGIQSEGLQKVYRISYIHLVHMSIIVLLLGISLCIALFFLVAFVWSVQGGQFDDPVTPAMRMLNDDDASKSNPTSTPPDKGPSA